MHTGYTTSLCTQATVQTGYRTDKLYYGQVTGPAAEQTGYRTGRVQDRKGTGCKTDRLQNRQAIVQTGYRTYRLQDRHATGQLYAEW